VPQAPPCPDPRDLERLALGQLPEPQAEALGRHLLSCSDCANTLNNLHARDTLTDALRGSQETQSVVIPAVEALMDRLARMPPTVTYQGTTVRQRVEKAMPAQIGRYQVLGRLGAGGMGTVYRAHDTQLRRDVALKVPRFHGTTDEVDEARQRFLREARAAAAVRNAHVCPIYDVGEQDGRPYVVIALVEGGSLAGRLKEGPFRDCREAVTLVCQVADGLAAVHAAGIVHRDLKPGNILLDKNGQALLTDFGLARAERDSEQLTAQGALVGTPAYMAPEQVNPEMGEAGPWSDQYSLAVVLYQMLTGRLPFEGSMVALIHQIGTNTPPPPSRHRPRLDAELERLLLTAMARRPQDRYANVREFERALLAWRDKQPAVALASETASMHAAAPPLAVPTGGPAATPPLAVPTGGPAATSPLAVPTGMPTQSVPKPRRWRPWWPVAGAALVLLAAGLFVVLALVIAGWHSNKRNADETGGGIGIQALTPMPAKIPGLESWSIETIGHRGSIQCLAFAPENKQLASAGVDGTIRLWSIDGRLLNVIYRPGSKNHRFGEFPAKPQALIWSPDGKTLACGDEGGDVVLFDVATGRQKKHLCSDGLIDQGAVALAWSPDGKLIAAAFRDDQAFVRTLNAATGEDTMPKIVVKETLDGFGWGWVPDLPIFTPDSKSLVITGVELQLWDLESQRKLQVLADKTPSGRPLGWLRDGKTLVTSNCLWDLGDKKSRPCQTEQRTFAAVNSTDGKNLVAIWDRGISSASLSDLKWTGMTNLMDRTEHLVGALTSDGTHAVMSFNDDAHLRFYRVGEKDPCVIVRGNTCGGAVLSPDAKTLATTNAWEGGRHELNTWNTADGRRLANQPQELPKAWLPSSDELLCHSRVSGESVIFKADSLRPVPPATHTFIPTIGAGGIVAWSPDGKRIAVFAGGGNLTIFDVTGKELEKHDLPYFVDEMAWSPDGTRLAVAPRGPALIYRVGSKEKPIQSQTDRPVSRVAWSPDGRWLAAAGNALMLVEASTGKMLQKDPAPWVGSVAFSRDGKRLAALHYSSVRIWDVEAWKPLKEVSIPPMAHVQVFSGQVGWLADDRTIFVARSSGVICFDAQTGKRGGTLLGLDYGDAIAVNAEGHYRGTPGAQNHIVYVTQTKDGTMLVPPAEFAKCFDWTNQPDRVRLSSK
jgi:WD40 repeat protein